MVMKEVMRLKMIYILLFFVLNVCFTEATLSIDVLTISFKNLEILFLDFNFFSLFIEEESKWSFVLYLLEILLMKGELKCWHCYNILISVQLNDCPTNLCRSVDMHFSAISRNSIFMRIVPMCYFSLAFRIRRNFSKDSDDGQIIFTVWSSFDSILGSMANNVWISFSYLVDLGLFTKNGLLHHYILHDFIDFHVFDYRNDKLLDLLTLGNTQIRKYQGINTKGVEKKHMIIP